MAHSCRWEHPFIKCVGTKPRAFLGAVNLNSADTDQHEQQAPHNVQHESSIAKTKSCSARGAYSQPTAEPYLLASSKMPSDRTAIRRTKATAGLAVFALSLSCVLVACTWSWAFLDLQQTALLNQVRFISVDFHTSVIYFHIVHATAQPIHHRVCSNRTHLPFQIGTDLRMSF